MMLWSGWTNQKCKGSMTVEAALVMSLILLIFMGCLKMTVDLHQRTAKEAEIYWVELEDADRKFRLFSMGREFME